MKVQDILRAQFAQTHGILELAVGDLATEALHYVAPGSAIGSIAAVYAHAIFTEDRMVNVDARGVLSVYDQQGWAAKASVPWPPDGFQTPEWALGVRMELPAFRVYARAVYAATDRYIAVATEEEMDRLIDNPAGEGKLPIGHFLGALAVWHITNHQGEIAALQGLQGRRGLPF